MSESENRDKSHLSTSFQAPFLDKEEVEQRIARLLDEHAAQVQFSPELRVQITRHLPKRHKGLSQTRSPRYKLLPALSLACALVLLVGLVIATIRFLQPAPTLVSPALVFSHEKALPTPTQLAQNGQLLSLDPTGQHLVYGITNQAGVMYTTDLTAPVANNHLAMEDARDVSWSPDGSALVTTIYPAITPGPLLALVPNGKYMHLLGQQALAASWLPTAKDAITYITQSNGQATLWSITSEGQDVHILATFSLALLVQHMQWSPDGRFLAILTADNAAPSVASIQGASRGLFLFDRQSGSIKALVAPGNFTLDSLTWSPNGHILSYEKRVIHGANTLSSLDLTTGKTLFTIPLQQHLLGLSWSPDSRALIYSDGGTLRTSLLGGKTIVLPRLSEKAEYPFWLDSQHLLYLALSGNTGQLVQLAAHPNA